MQHEERWPIGSVVPSFVPRLAEARERLMRALEDSDPFAHQRAFELAEIVGDLLVAVGGAVDVDSVAS